MTELAPQIIIAVCAALTFTATVAGMCTKLFLSKLTDARELAHREVKAADHRVTNLATRVDALEKRTENDGVRLVRLEVTMENMSRVLERIEAKIDRHYDS